ncbi:hypothetical protein ASF53_11420 [Methylobacterium sp. Leaf123]|uniref:DUF6880 family protein n=1 Tax=Methylobacterium sp. Leaf123 TaxID=1736264 RepID=UPI0006FB2965|nr:DUF6880 family protein [Methylobacterium sp. Leaf123]KQQ13578.1 hypothetical protein ASF53_11420 [Methylobacterium sp. Leaf123]
MARRAKAAVESEASANTPTESKPQKKSRSTTPTAESLAALSQERLIALILQEVGQSAPFKKRVSAAIAALQGPDRVAALIDRRLSALEKARGYIDWQKRRAFAADLDATLATILSDLKPLDAGMALDRLLRFLRSASATLERVDDSSGQVHGLYEATAEAAAGLAAGLSADAALVFATRALDALDDDGFGLVGALLVDLLPKLPKAALEPLDAHLVEALAKLPASAKKTGPAASERAGQEWERRYQRLSLTRLRQVIADARGDADAFIALELEMSPERPDLAAVAERLLAAGRAAEALDWIRRKQKRGTVVVTREDLIVGGFDPEGPEREREAVEIRILDALGRKDEAQSLRWARFEKSLDPQALRDYLTRLPDFEDEEALDRAFTHAASRKDPHGGLYFLIRWPNLDRAARLVLDRREAWSGRIWELLAPAAEALEPDHPLAASVLYRALIDDILERGRSPAYGHGARHLTRLSELARELAPGDLTPSHAEYVAQLRKAHGRKSGFWSQVEG